MYLLSNIKQFIYTLLNIIVQITYIDLRILIKFIY